MIEACAEISGECKFLLSSLFKFKLLNDFLIKLILFFGLYFSNWKLTYRYSKPEDKNCKPYFFEIFFAPVVLPLAEEPSAAIINLWFF